ncbi:ankyrin repeat protein mann-cup [Haemaphysalis longicornis]
MWITGKTDQTSQRDAIFNDLYSECRLAPPGARLSYLVRNKIERLTREERKDIVSRLREGCAPLFVACKKGNSDIVEYLITMCGADLEQRGVYEVTDDRSIHFVTPLWCAAVAGKLAVVKQLIDYGANVNSVSDSGSTPVRSACFMSHREVVMYLVNHGADILKPNYNGGTCLINSVQSVSLCRFLLRRGADVNAQDVQLKTALHYAIQEHRFDTTRLLLEQSANPFLRSRYGDDALQTACLKGAAQIYEYLVGTVEYGAARRAEADELMGTTFLDEHHDVQSALFYWRRAQALRAREGVPKPLSAAAAPPRAAFQMAREYASADELEALAHDLDALRTQSLLMCERILGPQHKDTVFRLMYRGAAYADGLQYQRCIDLWQYALELRVARDTLLHTEAGQAAAALVRLYLDMLERAALLRDRLRLEDVLATARLLVDRCADAAQLLAARPVYRRHLDNFDKLLRVLTHLLYVLHTLPKRSPADEAAVRRLVAQALAQRPRNSVGDSLLHLVVSRANTMKPTAFFEEAHAHVFPDAALATLLLECGADPEAVNEARSTPLHVAALRNNFRPAVVQALLSHGAHLDRRNANGNQPHRMLAGIAECSLNPLQHISLQCLAARKIVERRIPFVGEVPSTLEDFIRIH